MSDLSLGANYTREVLNPQDLLSTKTPGAAKAEGKSFADVIGEAVNEVNDMQLSANKAIEDLAVGRKRTLHETMIEVERASIGFQMLMSVRNKAISAYQEVMRMSF